MWEQFPLVLMTCVFLWNKIDIKIVFENVFENIFIKVVQWCLKVRIVHNFENEFLGVFWK